MTGSDPKTDLHRYLQDAREALLWKLHGLTEYNIRRPMVPTGTNLLGLIKHVASVELGYFGDTFGRPSGERLPWLENDAEPNADMWATADESREQITGLYRRAWAHSDATIGALALDDIGHVPWWPENRSALTPSKTARGPDARSQLPSRSARTGTSFSSRNSSIRCCRVSPWWVLPASESR